MSTSSGFELILDEILKHKRLLEEMQAENESLRQQLAELRAGKGITVDILGQRFLLSVEEPDDSLEVVSAAVSNEVPAPESDDVPSQPLEPVSEDETAIINSTPIPVSKDSSDDFLLEEYSGDGTPFPATAPAAASNFLEEALLEEFANASTRQMHVWSGPITNHPTLDEQEKASLRRELMGSFLLE